MQTVTIPFYTVEVRFESAEGYFAQSEQLPTRFELSFGKSTMADGPEHWRAGGVMLQHMPKASPFAAQAEGTGEILQPVDLLDDDETENWGRVNILLDTVDDLELIGPTLEPSQVLLRLFHEESPRVFDKQHVHFGCTCSEDRVRQSLSIYSAQDIGTTVIGNDNWIMAYVHIAHDCVVGNSTIFANNATLAGHVHIEDHAILGGFSLVHQFCYVGEYAFTGMGTALTKDLPPYVTAYGSPALPRGINKEGLKRNGFSADSIARIKQSYRFLYRQDLPFQQALIKMEEAYAEFPEIMAMYKFCRRSERGIIR